MTPKQYGLPPLIQVDARLIILGSFPGVASLKEQQYYGYTHNQFWSIVGFILNKPNLREQPYEVKKGFLKSHKIALWDVYKACERHGSLDANIKKGEANDLKQLKLWAPRLKVIAHNGKISGKFQKQISELKLVKEEHIYVLPSSSPANAMLRMEEKALIWREVFLQAGLIK